MPGGSSFVLAAVLLLCLTPVLGLAFTHYSNNPRGHAHANHTVLGLIVLGLLIAFLTQTNVIHDVGHAFGNGTVRIETAQPAPVMVITHKPAEKKAVHTVRRRAPKKRPIWVRQ